MDPRRLFSMLGLGGPMGIVMEHSPGCGHGDSPDFERPVIVGALSQQECEKAQEADDYDAKMARLKEEIRILHARKHIAESELNHMVQDRLKLPPNKPMHINFDTRQVITERVVAEGLNLEFTVPGEVEAAPMTKKSDEAQ